MSGDHGEELHGADGQCDSKHTAESSKQRALEQDLPEQGYTTHSHCTADGIFLLPLQSSHEEESGGVSACNEEFQGRCTKQRQENALAVAVHFVAEGQQARREALILLLGVGFSGCEYGQFLLRLLLSRTIAETSNQFQSGSLRFLGSVPRGSKSRLWR